VSNRPHLLLLDGSCLNRLLSPELQARLRRSLRATGKEFWPTGMNVLEALKSRRREMRIRLLSTLSELAGENHALTLPTEVLRKVCESYVTEGPVDLSDPRLTQMFREPESVTDSDAAEVRALLVDQEKIFDGIFERAVNTVRPAIKAEGGRNQWASVSHFLKEVWVPEFRGVFLEDLWEMWKLPGRPPVERILANKAWRLFSDGFGATMYVRVVAHPQRRFVQSADLQQLIYFGMNVGSAVLATHDREFRNLGNSILSGSDVLGRIVTLENLLA
jgi:hypothetical protein